MSKPPSLLRTCCITGICAGIVLLIAAANLWIGILSTPILYAVSDALLSE